jgi:hypothetical protein
MPVVPSGHLLLAAAEAVLLGFPLAGLLLSKHAMASRRMISATIATFLLHNALYFAGYSLRGDLPDYLVFCAEYLAFCYVVFSLKARHGTALPRLLAIVGMLPMFAGALFGILSWWILLVVISELGPDKAMSFVASGRTYEARRYCASSGFDSVDPFTYCTFETYWVFPQLGLERQIGATKILRLDRHCALDDGLDVRIGLGEALGTASRELTELRALSEVAARQSHSTEGAACPGVGVFACSKNGRSVLECRGNHRFAAIQACEGPGGCAETPNGAFECALAPIAEGTACAPTHDGPGAGYMMNFPTQVYACSTESQQLLVCSAGKFASSSTCRGPGGCRALKYLGRPAYFQHRCDDSVAQAGDRCNVEGAKARGADGRAEYVCLKGHFVASSGVSAPPRGI